MFSLPDLSKLQLPSGERRRRLLLFLGFLVFILVLNLHSLKLAFRDAGYLLRPLWDSPEAPFEIVRHYARPPGPVDDWCALHGWSARSSPPTLVDAVPVSSELDLLEIRMIEGAPYVHSFVVVEANASFSGAPKPLHFANARSRFDALAENLGVKIVYQALDDFVPVEKGSMVNEHHQRRAIAALLEGMVNRGDVPEDSLILVADVDEIVSRKTLGLIAACEVPDIHLNLDSYRYSFAQPLRDEGSWRAHVSKSRDYEHGRRAQFILADAGWHCTFCFPTLEDMRAKMAGYGHNDRLSSPKLLEEDQLRERVCNGEDPFDMFPEAFSFKDIVAQSGDVRPTHGFTSVPQALKEQPLRWKYLLDGGCERPNE